MKPQHKYPTTFSAKKDGGRGGTPLRPRPSGLNSTAGAWPAVAASQSPGITIYRRRSRQPSSGDRVRHHLLRGCRVPPWCTVCAAKHPSVGETDVYLCGTGSCSASRVRCTLAHRWDTHQIWMRSRPPRSHHSWQDVCPSPPLPLLRAVSLYRRSVTLTDVSVTWD